MHSSILSIFPSPEHEFHTGIKSAHCPDPNRIGYLTRLQLGIGELYIVVHQKVADESFHLVYGEVASRTDPDFSQ